MESQVFVTTEAEQRDAQYCQDNNCRDCGKTSRFVFQDRYVGKVVFCGQCFFDTARFQQKEAGGFKVS